MIRFRRALAPLLLAALGFACQASGPASPDEAPVVVRVELSASELELGPDGDRTSFTIDNRGDAPVEWRIESISAEWISVDRESGALTPGESATITVIVSRDDLSRGTHSATIRVLAGDREHDVTVSVEHAGTPRPALAPGSIELDTSDSSGELRVQNTGDAPLEWAFSGPDWVSFEPASGRTEPSEQSRVTVTPDRSRLSPGSHTARLSLDSNGGDATATLTVEEPRPPSLRLDPDDLDFGSTSSSRTVTVINDGELALDWTVNSGVGWVSVDPDGGTVSAAGDHTVTVRVSRGGLSAGTHRATLQFQSNGGTGSLAITLRVPAPPDDGGGSDGGSDGGSSDDSATVALEGQVLHQFSRSGMDGVTVRFDDQTIQTDADGRFKLMGEPSNDLRALALGGSGTIGRNTFARTGDDQWLVIPGSFDMRAFDDMAREYEPRTIRWVRDPDVYFDVTPPSGFPQGSEYDVWVDEVRGVLASFISGWTNGRIRAARLTVGTSPPQAGSPGVIVIGFSEDPTVYNDPNTVGLARTFWTTDRSIYSARIWLRFGRISGSGHSSTRTAVVGHELGHALGMGHMDGSTKSIMTPSISISVLSAFDRQAGNVLYTRSPGNTSPDSDSQNYYRGGLSPAAAGLHEWVCGPPGREF